MNIVIVDDNLSAIVKLRDYVGTFFSGSLVNVVIKTYLSGEEFLRSNDICDSDILFLDIFMKEINGIDVALQVRKANNDGLIIFVSSSNSFATESYDVGATGYLTKPYEYDKFYQVMQHVVERAKKNASYFDFKASGAVKRIQISKINFVDYFNHYVQIHTESDMAKSYIVTFADVSKTLLTYSNFLLCYRNVIINMDKVSKIEGKCFVMQSGDTIPINREKAKEVKEEYHAYLFRKIEGGV